MVVQLEPWDSAKVYDRMGLDNDYISIMDIKVPVTVVPVKPGRNLAIIIEVAAMNNRQKKWDIMPHASSFINSAWKRASQRMKSLKFGKIIKENIKTEDYDV